MDIWNLYTQEGLYSVTDNGLSLIDDPVPNEKCILSPSYNYRKFLTVPTDINRDLESITIDLFKKSLPEQINQFKYQFVNLSSNEHGEQEFLALAIEKEKYNSFEERLPDVSELYFFESIIGRKRCDDTKLLKIQFPDGIFYGVFNNRLNWSRFITKPDETQIEMTRDYIQDNFEILENEKSISITRDEKKNSNWIEFFEDVLSHHDASFDLLTQTKKKVFRSLQFATKFIIVVSLLASITWVYYEKKSQSKINTWINKKYEQVVGEPSSEPVSETERRMTRLKNQLETTENRLFPRLVTLDKSISNRAIKVFRIKFSQERTDFIGFSKNLEEAERFRRHLDNKDSVKSATIKSTNSMSLDQYNYKIQLGIQWTS